MEKNINLSTEAAMVISALKHKNGTYDYYCNTLSRLHMLVLYQSCELGMRDTEAMHTLRVLDALRMDLAALSGRTASEEKDTTAGETAAGVDSAFDGVGLESSENETDLQG